MALPIRQGATHKVLIGPAVAVGDGFTPVTTLALSTADEAEALVHDSATVVDISGYTWAAVTTADGYYVLTLQSGISGTVGHMTVLINDDSLCLPVRADFTVLDTGIYDSIYADAAVGLATQASVDVIDGIVDSILVDTGTTLDAALAVVDANVDAILVDTGTTIPATISTAQADLDIITGADGAVLLSGTQASIDAIESDTNELQADDYPTTIAAVKADTAAILIDTGTTLDGAITTIDGIVDAILVDTAEIGAAGAGLTDLGGMSTGMKGEVNAEADTALTDYDPPTRAELTTDTNSILAQLPAVAPVEGTADSGTTTTLVDAARTEADDDYWKGSWLLSTSGTTNGQCRLITGFTAASDTITFAPAMTQAIATNTYRIIPAGQLEEVLALTGHTVQTGDNYARLGAPAGASVSADVAAVKVDTAATLVDTGTTLPATLGTPAGADMAADIAAVKVDTAAILVDTGTTLDANITAIVADTNELQTDWADGGRLDLILDSASSAGDPWATALPGAYGAGTAGKIVGDNVNAPIQTVDTVVDAIKAVTDLLPDAGALNDLAAILTDTGTTLDAALAVVDANVDAILVDTATIGTPAGASVSADIAAVKVDTAAVLVDTADMQPKLGTPAADVSADIAAVKADTAATLTDTGTTLDAALAVVDGNVDAIKAVTDLLTLAAINAEADTAWTTQMADSIPADGVISTREQALYAVLQILTEFSISGTTMTVKKVDGSTSLMTLTLDDGTNPTSLTRAT